MGRICDGTGIWVCERGGRAFVIYSTAFIMRRTSICISSGNGKTVKNGGRSQDKGGRMIENMVSIAAVQYVIFIKDLGVKI